ncbi:MAG: class I SAM-dependent methyltransferase [Acetobacteraceae bacterium]
MLAPCRILLPGAGRSGEPLALARDGFDVTIVDSAPSPVAVQRVRMQAAGLAADVREADLLAWTPDAPFRRDL